MKLILFPACIITALAVAACPAFAQQDEDKPEGVEIPTLRIGNEAYVPHGKLHLGPFRLHPFLSEYFGQDSNVFLVEDDPVSSSILVTEAGMRFDLAQSRQLLLMGYRIRFNSYGDKDARDSTEHEANLSGCFRFDSFFLKLDDDYAHLSEPTPAYFNTKARREENKGSAAIGLDMSRLYLEASYSARRYHFEGKDYDRANNKQSIISGILGYKFSRKTQLKLRFDSGAVDYDYDIQNDYTYTSLFLGIDYRVSGKLLSYLYVGSTTQSVDTANDPSQTKEFSGVGAYGSLTYKLSEKTRLSMTLLREVQYNAYANYMVVTEAEAVLRYQLSRKIMLSLRMIFESSQPSQEIGEAGKSTKTTGGLSARYDFNRWLTAGLDVEFASKSASLDHHSFSDNKAFLFLTLHF
jgi:hypothetical protein